MSLPSSESGGNSQSLTFIMTMGLGTATVARCERIVVCEVVTFEQMMDDDVCVVAHCC